MSGAKRCKVGAPAVAREVQQAVISEIREKLALAVEELAQAMGLSREGDEILEANPIGAGMCFHEVEDILLGLSDSLRVLGNKADALGRQLAPEGRDL